MNEEKFDNFLQNFQFQNHRKDLPDSIIAASLAIKQKESLLIYFEILRDLLTPKIRFSLAALALACFIFGFNNTNSFNKNSISLVEDIYYSNSGVL